MKYTYKTNNNFLCPHGVYEDVKFKKQSLSAIILYTILCKLANRYADKKGWFYRSVEQLAEDTGLKPRTIMRAKQILRKNQFIDIKRTYLEHSNLRTYDSFRLNGFRKRCQ
ncbi:MAG: helix-turn-helix domain-containing protein [Candidatus Helarchaeota archaeon]